MKEQVIELAKQAGFHFWDAGFADKGILHTTGHKFSQKCFERFARLVRNAALEEAAHDCELLLPSGGLYHSEQIIWDIATKDCANAIRNLKDLTP